MIRPVLFFLILLCSAPPAAFAAAVIEGRVELPDTKSAPVMNKRYQVVTKGGVLSMSPPLAVVYLEGNFPLPETPPVAQIVQEDYMFIPALLPVQVGTRIEFPNLDDAYHNVFSYSRPKRFDLGRYRPDETPVPSQTFEEPGLVTLRCDIHEHMRGIILVLPTPYFVTTEADGTFRLGDLPAGHFTLKVWLDSRTTKELEVELTDGATLRADFP